MARITSGERRDQTVRTTNTGRPRSMVILLLAGLAPITLAGSGCSGNTTGGSADPQGGAGTSGLPGACVPNETRACLGPGACQGAQACNANGDGWTLCDCGASVGEGGGGSDGPAGGAGGAGGAGPTPSGGDDGFVACEVSGTQVTLPVTYRDFDASHSDFETGATGLEAATEGLIATSLDADGLPELVGSDPTIASAASFSEWYRDVADVNATVQGSLVLHDDDAGGYVNRWGENGEPWQMREYVAWCGEGGSDCSECNPLPEGTTCFDPCFDSSGAACAGRTVEHDGTPVFFPIDGHDDARTPTSEYATATIPPAYGGDWQAEPDGGPHNFHFTSELRYRFRFEAGQSYSIEVTGDDDLWIFVNGRLALDLGGIHTPVGGEVVIDSDSASRFGLEAGELHEVAIFHAERQTTGSTLRLRLSGFDWSTARCPAR